MTNCKITKLNTHDLMRKGLISCVLSQDWSVNRITPEFVDKDQLSKKVSNKQHLLHLGVGNGECYYYFNEQSHCDQTSISDKLYFDPSEVIVLYLKKCNISKSIIQELSYIMRDEFLISISYKYLLKYNINAFFDKDREINNKLHDVLLKYSTYSFSYSVLLLLLNVLNTNPHLLLPNNFTRKITPMGKHIIISKANSCFQEHKKLKASISLDDVVDIVVNRFEKINNIMLNDFRNVHLPKKQLFDYILATRSDAFLHKDYYRFINTIIGNIKEDGFYISDGILSSYSYKIYYIDLIKLINRIGKNRVFIVKPNNYSMSFPLREISGIIITGKKASIKNVYSFIPKDRIVSANNLYTDICFVKQCIWSDLVDWSTLNNIDLEDYSFKIIDDIIIKYINPKTKDLSPIIFSNEDFYMPHRNELHN